MWLFTLKTGSVFLTNNLYETCVVKPNLLAVSILMSHNNPQQTHISLQNKETKATSDSSNFVLIIQVFAFYI